MIDLEQIAYDIGVGKSNDLTRWMLPIATLEKMIALIRKQEAALQESQDLIAAQVRLIDAMTEQAAPAAAVVTVDSTAFQLWLSNIRNSDAPAPHITALIAHIDAHTAKVSAKAREEGNTQGWAECEGDMQPESDMKLAAKQVEIDHLRFELHEATDSLVARLSAPQQHAQALPKWIDDQKGKDPLIDDLIAYIEGHPVQQHAQAAQQSIVAYELHGPADHDGRESPEVRIVFTRKQSDEYAEEGWILYREFWSSKPTRSFVGEQTVRTAPRVTGNAQAALSDEVIDHMWKMYQQGQGSADHTAKEVFAQTLQSLADWLPSQQPVAAPSAPANAGPAPGDMPIDRLVASLPLPVYAPPTPPQEAAARDERAAWAEWSSNWEGEYADPEDMFCFGYVAALAAPAAQVAVPEAVIKDAVNRFLGWKLPKDFQPDCGVSFKPLESAGGSWPIGTNLLSADQAEAMFQYCLPSLAASPSPVLPAAEADAASVGVTPVPLSDPWVSAVRSADNLCPFELSTPDKWRWKAAHMQTMLGQPSPAQGEELSQQADLPEPVYLGGDEAFGDAVTGYTAEHIMEARQQGRTAGVEEAVTWLVNQRHLPGIIADTALRALNK